MWGPGSFLACDLLECVLALEVRSRNTVGVSRNCHNDEWFDYPRVVLTILNADFRQETFVILAAEDHRCQDGSRYLANSSL